MPGQATVTIGEQSWAATIASTSAELLAGLSGVVSIPANTGILFDMGSAQGTISINMAEMLFNLDIVFLNVTGGVVGILRDVAPGDAVAFDAGEGLGAQYFLEVNAGEAVDVSVGDIAVITIITEEPSTDIFDISSTVNLLIGVMIVGMMMKMMAPQSSTSSSKQESWLLGPGGGSLI